MTFNFPVYVISVKSFHDRHEHIRNLASQYGFEPRFIWDYDAEEVGGVDWLPISPKLNLKSASNVCKHLEAQRRLLQSEHDYALILEDDVIFLPGFKLSMESLIEKLKVLSPGWLVFLGGLDNKIDSRFLSSRSNDLIEQMMTTAEAYLVDRSGCEQRLSCLESMVVDRQADHFLSLIDRQLGIKHFWPKEPLCTQGSVTGRFVTTLDQNRARKSKVFLKTRFIVRWFFRQRIKRVLSKLVRGLRG